MTGALGFIAFIFALWALGAAQVSLHRTAPKKAPRPLQGQQQPPKAKEPVVGGDPMFYWKQNKVPFDFETKNFRCAACERTFEAPAGFFTKLALEMPFLDGTLPISVELCKDCINLA
jgi:hypothetical protein